MAIVRVVYRPDKSVVILHYAKKSKFSREEAFDRMIKQSNLGLEGLPYDDIDDSQLPQSREHRNSWEGEKGVGVTVNQIKANALDSELLIKQEMEDLLKKEAIQNLKNKGLL